MNNSIEQAAKKPEFSKQALDHARRLIALKWTKETNIETIAGTWDAGYTFGQIDASASYKEQEGCRWISVKDRLPEKYDEEYIVYGHSVTTFNWTKKGWFSDVFNQLVDKNSVTHWMPLPNPPLSQDTANGYDTKTETK